MLIIEQLLTPHSHSPASNSISMSNVKSSRPTEVEFDAELGDLEVEQGMPRSQIDMPTPTTSTYQEPSGEMQAIPLTLGLVIHSLADGFALGVSFFPALSDSKESSNLSFIVFLAIIIHKCEYLNLSEIIFPNLSLQCLRL